MCFLFVQNISLTCCSSRKVSKIGWNFEILFFYRSTETVITMYYGTFISSFILSPAKFKNACWASKTWSSWLRDKRFAWARKHFGIHSPSSTSLSTCMWHLKIQNFTWFSASRNSFICSIYYPTIRQAFQKPYSFARHWFMGLGDGDDCFFHSIPPSVGMSRSWLRRGNAEHMYAR